MKKYIYSILLIGLIIISNHELYSQDTPPCPSGFLEFSPTPDNDGTISLGCGSNNITVSRSDNMPGTFVWYNANGDSISVNPLTAPPPGTYTIEITSDVGTCSQEIIVNDWGTIPIEIFAPDDTCQGTSFNVLATSSFDYEYTWTIDGVVSEDDDAAVFINTLMSNSVDIALQVDSAGCSGFASSTITVHAPPSLTPTATPNPLCIGDAITVNAGLTPAPGVSYEFQWNTGDTSSEFFPAPTQDTIYAVTVNDTNGCIAVGSVNVQVNPIPDATISADNESICLGQNTTLNAPMGMDTYLWTPTGETTPSIIIMPMTDTDYSVQVSKDNCTNTDNISITVITPGSITIQGDTEICLGDSTTLTAPSAGTYTWSDGSDEQSITVSPAMEAMYSVTVTTAGCESNGQTTVTVNPAPDATITGGTEICEGESTMLTASGGGTYEWSTNETSQSITVVPTETTTYTVTVTATNGCTDIESQMVNITSVDLTITGDTEICEGESAMLTASPGGTYEWSTNETSQSIVVEPAETTTYTVTKTVNGCELSENITVGVNPIYNISITETICPDSSYTVGNSTYTETGNYTDVLTAENGCDSTVNLNLTVQPIPSFQSLEQEIFGGICSRQAITVNIQDPLYEFAWRADNSDNIIIGAECTALNIQDDPAVFYLDVSANNCLATNTFNINLTALATDAKVFRFANTNTLFCNRNDFDSYQWGKEDKNTLCPEPMTGETYQDVVVQDLDTSTYYYWVEVTEGDCTTRIYLEGLDNSPFSKLTQEPDVEYGDLALQISPNPNNGTFELTITGDEVRDLDIDIYDALGRTIYHQDAPKIASIETYYILIPKLTQGLYFARVTGNDGILLSKKIIVR